MLDYLRFIYFLYKKATCTMHKPLFSLIILVLCFTGCAPSTVTPEKGTDINTVPSRMEEVTPAPTAATDTHDKTRIPKSILQATPTHARVSSPTVTPDIPITSREQIIGNTTPIPICSAKGVPKTPEKGFGIPGTLFYQTVNDSGLLSGLYYVSGIPLKQGTLYIGENSPIYVFGISPDEKWLAYSSIVKAQNEKTNFKNPSIILLGADGERVEHTLDLDWLNNINEPGYQTDHFAWGYWVNDYLIFTLVNSKIPGDNIGTGLYYLALLDPFHGTWRTKEFVHLPDQTGLFGAAFSPDLRHVLYDSGGITLLEIDDNGIHKLWHDQHGEFSSLSAAKWSPDGDWVVFANRRILSPDPAQLFLISKDGKKVYEIQNQEMGSFFKNFYWSPNGRYFAYVSEKYPGKAEVEEDLLIFDVDLGTFTLECPIQTVDLPLAELTWSPGSNLIAISQEGETLRVLDITSGSMVDLNIDGVAVGWADNFLK